MVVDKKEVLENRKIKNGKKLLMTIIYIYSIVLFFKYVNGVN